MKCVPDWNRNFPLQHLFFFRKSKHRDKDQVKCENLGKQERLCDDAFLLIERNVTFRKSEKVYKNVLIISAQ